MSLMNSFFGKEEKKEERKPEVVEQCVEELTIFARDTARRICNEEYFPDVERQAVMAAYTFGAVYGLGQQHQLSKADIQETAERLFRSPLCLPEEDITYKIPALFNAVDPAADKLLNMLLYQGKKAFLGWRANRQGYDAADFRQAVQMFKKD